MKATFQPVSPPGGLSATFTAKGLRPDGVYHLGDQPAGQFDLVIRNSQTITRIQCELSFVLESDEQTTRAPVHRAILAERLGKLNNRTLNYPVRIPNRFGQISFLYGPLRSRWELNLIVTYPGTYNENVAQTIRFDLPVRRGRSGLRAAARPLAVPRFDARAWIGAAFAAVGLVLFGLAGDGELGPWRETLIYGGPILALLVVLAHEYLRLSSFQDTPAELIPGQHGGLRLRLLDRGNGLENRLTVGYRIRARFLTQENNEPTWKDTVIYRYEKPAAEVLTPRGSYLESRLPWPKEDYPTTRQLGKFSYRWEIVIGYRSPLFGDAHERVWPVQVTDELFVLPSGAAVSPTEEIEAELGLPPLTEATPLITRTAEKLRRRE